MAEGNPSAEKKKTGKDEEFIAIIRIRGEVNVRSDIEETLDMLGVSRKNNMAIHKKTPAVMGMVKKAENYVTYGEIPKEIADSYGLKKTFKMHPPRGGFERKGIKVPYSIGGALGYRGTKIVELMDKMRK